MEWRGPVARPRAVLQTVCLPRAVVNSSSLGRTLGGVVLKEVGNALGRLYGASHPLAVAGGQIANPKYGGTTDGVARKTICFGSLVFLGFVLWGLGVRVCVSVCAVVVVAGRSVECVWSVCVGNVWLLVQGVPSVSVWSGLDTLPPHPLSAGHGRLLHNWYLSHSSHRQCRQPQGRTKCRGTNQGGGGRSEGRGVRCWAAATLTCPRTTHRTQLTAHSSQHTARVHTHTGTQGHTVGTLGGLALSSASTHSSGPPNDAHHGRSALHQRRQAASRSSPWWTPPPSG